MDMKIKCELCGNTMLPVSMAAHMRLSHGPNSKSYGIHDGVVNNEEEGSNVRLKRRAAEK